MYDKLYRKRNQIIFILKYLYSEGCLKDMGGDYDELIQYRDNFVERMIADLKRIEKEFKK